MFRVGIAALIGAQVAFLDVVQAWGGECIIGITQACVSNYTHPVAEVLAAFNRDLNNQFFLGEAQIDAVRLVAPLYANFAIGTYNRTNQDIFPSYFHGKCWDKNGGVEPSEIQTGELLMKTLFLTCGADIVLGRVPLSG
ncbi:uncharacterized protein EI90DRAFT_207902 [Cantharellus anzutake]|uniref:uncharacterized protein n=1 Tax=Cantharellus anzutake TaxID=1750568 RepID=UPI001906AAE2|nr:uncharacterized protein EI90DRAFT_207902 [Cantharellus anzutake]KAF8317299.1 hypothetical protein EI90DRAFT_207902 [Cantharellus anzutake]